MAQKRALEEDPQLTSKIQRVEHADPASPHRPSGNDFSVSVKRKLADSKRTGQACDRCKVRKIRCDGRPDGCTPCEQNRTPCCTTDRITGRPKVRGHAEALESELSFLRRQNADLQAQVKEMGGDPRAMPAYDGTQPPSQPWAASTIDDEHRAWANAPLLTTASPLRGYAPASLVKSDSQLLPHFKHGSIGDNYLGVSAGDSPLSHIKGTSLSIFGTEVDITDFVTGEVEYESSSMSYTTLIRISLAGQHVEAPPLPAYKDLKDYAGWYLRSLNPYTMLVHKPTLMDLIRKCGTDPKFTPRPSELVMVHMMLATLQYQIATRNKQQDTNLLEDSHRHYQYALSHYTQLLLGPHRLEDVQALAMICHHMRNFPKPGPAWIMTSITYLFALELGLHRSVKAWADSAKMSAHEIEMRKRVFWCLNALQVNLNGKLGRPMPISNEDIDVEFPEPLNDCLPGEETSLDPFHQCSFQVGIQIAKYTLLELDLYKTIYAVRHSPRSYVKNLNRLETRIHQWKEELPNELRNPAQASSDNYIFALYLEYWYQSYQLLLHHPAVCRSADISTLNSNLDKCKNAAQKMLDNCSELMQKKSLDIPWINTVVYIAAAFTTLFISTVRKEQLTPVDMTKLKSDMAIWVDVLGECDQFLGSGEKLKNAISKIIDQSLNIINESIVKRTATESLARVALQTPRHSTSSTPGYENGAYREVFSTTSSVSADTTPTPQTLTFTGLTENAHPYNLGNPVSMPLQQASSVFAQHSYGNADEAGMTPTHAAALAAATSSNTSQPASDTYTYANTQAVNNGHQPTYTANGLAPQDWSQWTRAYMQPQLGQPGDFLNTATTLMTLGQEPDSQDPGTASQGLVDSSGVQGIRWPNIAFPGPTNGHIG